MMIEKIHSRKDTHIEDDRGSRKTKCFFVAADNIKQTEERKRKKIIIWISNLMCVCVGQCAFVGALANKTDVRFMRLLYIVYIDSIIFILDLVNDNWLKKIYFIIFEITGSVAVSVLLYLQVGHLNKIFYYIKWAHSYYSNGSLLLLSLSQ